MVTVFFVLWASRSLDTCRVMVVCNRSGKRANLRRRPTVCRNVRSKVNRAQITVFLDNKPL